VNDDGLLKMSELAQRSGVSAGTIKHYLREGLLGEGEGVVRTPGYVERITLIKRLQEDRFMPLKVIKGMLDEDPDRALALVELEDKIIERALERRESARTSQSDIQERYDLPQVVLDRLAEIGVLTPTARGYDADDVAIIEAMVRFRAGGYDEALGFTVYDTLRYREALQPLVEEEITTMLGRLAGEVEPDRAADIIASGTEPLRELLGAMHSKLMLAELRRQASSR
jgi:DNA-binding transcriptional MerR regulator